MAGQKYWHGGWICKYCKYSIDLGGWAPGTASLDASSTVILARMKTTQTNSSNNHQTHHSNQTAAIDAAQTSARHELSREQLQSVGALEG